VGFEFNWYEDISLFWSEGFNNEICPTILDKPYIQGISFAGPFRIVPE
jgi:hypothetical protein